MTSPSPGTPLGPHEVHVWYARTDGELPVAAFTELLDETESPRLARFLVDHARREFLVGRALVRTTLSRYAAVDPRAWRFVQNAHGHPRVASPAAPPLVFNLSHTRGLAACAVTWDREVGVDVEWVDRRGETVAIADRFFAPPEVAALHALPEADRRDRFFAYWTLKEAYIKARGMGLAIPLAQFAFELDRPSPDGRPRVAFDPRLGDDAGSWQFDRLRPTPEHAGAVAVRRRGDAPLTVVERDAKLVQRPHAG